MDLEHAADAADLLAAVLAGGRVTVCTQCARRRDVGESDVLPGVRVAGAPTFVEEALVDGTQALVQAPLLRPAITRSEVRQLLDLLLGKR